MEIKCGGNWPTRSAAAMRAQGLVFQDTTAGEPGLTAWKVDMDEDPVKKSR